MGNNMNVRIVGLAALASWTLFTGCGNEGPDQTTVVTAELRLTASDVRCLVLKAVGTTTVTQQADVEGETNSTMTLTGIPTGSVTFTASAYSVKCASTGSSSATYVSDPITQTVVLGTPINLVFKMRPANATGGGSVVFDFPDGHGRATEFPDTAVTNGNFGIIAGPDGNMWFTIQSFGLGVMSTAGTLLTNYRDPAPSGSTPTDLAADANGYVWFVDPGLGALWRSSVSGTVVEFKPPTANSQPTGITLGPDGNMWFVEGAGNKIGKITALGVITEYSVPTANALPARIAAGPDGNLWFTEANTSKVGRITTSGTITEFATPTTGALPLGIVAGPDGNLWICENGKNKVAKVTTSGAFTEFTLPTANSTPNQITRGPDGNLWVTLNIGGVDKITPSGAVTEYPYPDRNNPPIGIATGPDGNLWIVSGGTNNFITRMTP